VTPIAAGQRAGPAIVLLAAAVLLLTRLDGIGLWAPDEPRYASVAENVRAATGVGDRILLHLNGDAYTQKPPLYFWLAALAGASGGHVSEWAARLPSALAGIALVAVCALGGGALLGTRTAIAGAMILLTSWDVAHLGRRAQLDVLLTLFTTIALLGYWRAQRSERLTRAAIAIVHAAIGLAVLTKGPVGLLIPLLVIVAHRALLHARGEPVGFPLRTWLPLWGLALSLGPGIVWVSAATALAPSGYFETAVIDNLWGRFAEGTSHARPFYYYLYQFPIHFLPWTPLWFAVAWAARRRVFRPGADDERARAWRFALVWVGVTLLMFSVSAGKRAIYLLPAFPAMALLCADAAWIFLDERRPVPRAFGIGVAAVLALLIFAGVAGPVVAPAYGVAMSWQLGAATAAIGLVGAGAWRQLARFREPNPRRLALVASLFAGALAVELAMFIGYLPLLDAEKSARSLALLAASRSAPEEAIGLVDKRALVGALNYYGRRRVVELSDADSIRDFIDDGGTVLVVPAKRLQRVKAVAPVEIRGRSRSGRRELLVVEVPVRPDRSDRHPTPDAATRSRSSTRSPRRDSRAIPTAQTTAHRSAPAS